jgi:hypothetical protein
MGAGVIFTYFFNGYPVQLYHVESDANFTKNRSMPQLVILVRFAVVIVGSIDRAPDKGGVGVVRSVDALARDASIGWEEQAACV